MATYKLIRRVTRVLWTGVFILEAIGIGIVARRILIISGLISEAPAPSSGRPSFNASFNQPPLITVLHILPGLLFMILGPLQFMKSIRNRHPRFHHINGRVFIFSAYIVGLSAIIMPFVELPIGGLNEAVGSVFFAMIFLFALSKAWRHILRGRQNLHREWMLRAFAIGLAISTVRPIMVIAFAFFGLQPKEFLGTAFWLGFSIHLLIAEAWILYTRPAIPVQMEVLP